MAVPTAFTDLSTTAASNSPAGSENVFPSLDDYLRIHAAMLASIYANTATNGWVSPYATAASPTFTGVASFPDGSAAAPSITNTGDTNTGLYFSAADEVSIATGGTQRAVVDSSGNVGVGIAPLSKLTVLDSVAITNTAGTQYLLMGNQNSSGANNPGIIAVSNGDLRFGHGDSWASATGGTFTENVRFKNDGTVRFMPMAEPSTPEEGDVYMDSTTHKLRCYNGSTWNDLF